MGVARLLLPKAPGSFPLEGPEANQLWHRASFSTWEPPRQTAGRTLARVILTPPSLADHFCTAVNFVDPETLCGQIITISGAVQTSQSTKKNKGNGASVPR